LQDIALDDIVSCHTSLLDILFLPLSEETNRGLEGEEMPPIVVCKMGGRY
jgi:hypothetical protein